MPLSRLHFCKISMVSMTSKSSTTAWCVIHTQRVNIANLCVGPQTTLPKLPTHLSMQVRNLLEELESRQRHRRFNLLISRQGRDGTEMEFANMLAEDSNNDGPRCAPTPS